MVSSQEVDAKSTQDGNLVKTFLWKKANGECNVRSFRRFFFGMSSDVPACIQSPVFLQVTFNFELEVNL